MFSSLARLPLRQQLTQALNFILVFTTAYMTWKGLGILTNSESPIVVVLSGSMEPAFHRGDLLLLNNRQKRAEIGDIVVYNVKGRDIPIVHRVIKHHEKNGKQMLLTKGDNNPTDDLELYARGQQYLDRESEVVGIVKGFIPTVGMFTIWINETIWIKYALLGIGGVLMLFQRE